MSKLYLMRHGRSVVNLNNLIKCHDGDGVLTVAGRDQATRAGNWLADKDISAIYTSPFERAQETATIVSESLDLPVTTLPGLREVDCGDLEGRDDDDAWPEWWRTYNRWLDGEWDAAFPGGESFQQAFDRARHALQNARPDINTVMVTHGGITRAVVPFMSVNAAALQRIDFPDNTGFIVLEPYDNRRYVCESWNLIDHL